VNWSFPTWLGLAAAALTTSANIPQVWKAWRTQQTNDLSRVMMFTLASGLGLWVIYGILLADVVIVIANVTAFALASALTILKLRYG
jgi:MtN3 and saliva related transmembrane protein